MEFRNKRERIKGVCQVTLTTKLSGKEEELVKKYGEPEIEMGLVLDLPSKKAKLKSGFPYKQSFDAADLGHEIAEQNSLTYVTEIENRIKVALAELRALTDNLTGEDVKSL